jgi:hypothetical protein
MANKKLGHVRYVRKIPSGLVKKMDAYLESIWEGPRFSPSVKKALVAVDESRDRMNTKTTAQRSDLEHLARSVIRERPPLPKPGGKIL